jgi:hypothetical protein
MTNPSYMRQRSAMVDECQEVTLICNCGAEGSHADITDHVARHQVESARWFVASVFLIGVGVGVGISAWLTGAAQ